LFKELKLTNSLILNYFERIGINENLKFKELHNINANMQTNKKPWLRSKTPMKKRSFFHIIHPWFNV
jgi:hypothetical protein